MKQTEENVWECRAGDNHFGEYHSRFTLLSNGELEITIGDDGGIQLFAKPQSGTTSGGSISALVLSKAPAATKLVELLLAKASSTLVPSAIVKASTPKTAATALKLLSAYPSAVLDAASVEPLLAKDGARLQKLLLDESKESGGQSIQLVDALSVKSENIRAAVTAPAMLHAALTPAAARIIVRLLDDKGDGAFVAVATAMATEAFGVVEAEPSERQMGRLEEVVSVALNAALRKHSDDVLRFVGERLISGSTDPDPGTTVPRLDNAAIAKLEQAIKQAINEAVQEDPAGDLVRSVGERLLKAAGELPAIATTPS